jgi:hypothetical protein
MNLLALRHSHEMKLRADIADEKAAEELRGSQELLAEELSAFLPIDDSFITETEQS